MHIESDTKNRRKINFSAPLVKEVLPEYFAASYPKFISLLEMYYDYLDENDSTELLHHLLESRDITQVDLTLLDYIENELLLGNKFLDRRSTAAFSSTLLRAKGTKYSVQWFFRAFYGLDAEIVFPKENIFKLNDDLSTIGSESLRFLTDDKLYQIFAIMVKVGVPISQWKDLYKIMVHPAGMYLAAKLLLVSELDLSIILAQPDPGDPIISLGLNESSPLATNTTTAEGEIDIEYTPPVVYTLAAVPSSPNETTQKTVVFNISGTYIPNTPVFLYIEHVTTDANDFVEDPNDPIPTLTSRKEIAITNQSGSYTLNIAEDNATEGVQTFNAYIYDQQYPYGTLLATVGVAIDDTSLTPISIPTYNLIMNNIVEGQNLSFDISPADANGESVNWAITGNDVTGRIVTLTGQETNMTAVRTVTVNTTVDFEINGSSNGFVTVTGVNSGSQAIGSFQMDDAVTTYDVQFDPSSLVTEGNTLGFRIISRNSTDDQIDYVITGSGVTPRISSPDLTGSVTGMIGSNGNVTSSLIQIPTTIDGNINGNQTGTITLTGATSGETAQFTFTLIDAPNASITYSISGDTTITEPSS